MFIKRKELEKLIYNYRLKKIENYYQKKTFNLRNSIIISGHPRGGTTWVNDVIKADKKCFDIWEPMHPVMIREFYNKDSGFHFYKYIPKNQQNKELENYLNKVFKLHYVSTSLLQKNKRIKKYKESKLFLFKFVRLQETLPWFQKRYPHKKIIQLDRNPISVIASQINHGAWDFAKEWNYSSEKRNLLESYCPKFYSQFIDIIEDIDSIESLLTVRYALATIPRLHSQKSENLYEVKYEDLLKNGISEWEKIYNFMKVTPPENLNQLIIKPSSTTKKESNINKDLSKQHKTWRNYISEQQKDKIIEILQRFGFENISAEEYDLTCSRKINYFDD
jgi:hypothetical protein